MNLHKKLDTTGFMEELTFLLQIEGMGFIYMIPLII